MALSYTINTVRLQFPSEDGTVEPSVFLNVNVVDDVEMTSGDRSFFYKESDLSNPELAHFNNFIRSFQAFVDSDLGGGRATRYPHDP